MASLNLTPIAAPAVTGLSIQTGNHTANLFWDEPIDPETMFEVWSNTTNVIGTATKLAYTASNSFTPTGLVGQRYFWVRSMNRFGVFGVFTASVVTTLPTLTVSPTAGSAVATPVIPTVAVYNTWYSVGSIVWTAADTDIITCTGFVTTAITNVMSVLTDRIVVFVRSRLFNVTTGAEVWAGVQTQLIYDRHGATDYGPLNNVTSENDTFMAGSPGLLRPGTQYRWTIEVKKQQVIGTPTLDLTVIDSSCFADAASVTA